MDLLITYKYCIYFIFLRTSLVCLLYTPCLTYNSYLTENEDEDLELYVSTKLFLFKPVFESAKLRIRIALS